MKRKKSRLAVVAFKVEEELARLLNEIPNKSDFIRKAIEAQLRLTCPLCNGKGAVSGWMHESIAPLLESLRVHACVGCGEAQLVPGELGLLGAQDRVRLEQFFQDGPLYCRACFETAWPCGECGWRIDAERIEAHRQALHAKKLR